jgi:ribosomal protein L37AE/L43A
MLSSACPCCSNTLLRHIRSGEVYWFCRHCHQKMPNYATLLSTLTTNTKLRCESRLTKSSFEIFPYV